MGNINGFLRLPFAGNRDYLQGAGLFSGLLKIVGESKDLSLRMHKLTSKVLKTQVVSHREISELRSSGELCALLIYSQFNQRQMISVTETAEAVTARLPYDEEQVVRDAVICEEEILQDFPVTGSFIQRTVALNKMLLNAVVVDQPWLFTRIDLKKAPVRPLRLSLRLLKQIGGRSYQSTITGDGDLLGSIYFSTHSK